MSSAMPAALKCFLLATGLVCAVPAAAQGFPDRQITIYNGYSSGGTSSITFRALADASARTLGRKVVVEDRPGAGGVVAVTAIARNTKPDGYTVGQMPQPMLRIPHMQPVNFDILNDFTWIIRIVDYTYGLAVKGDAPWRNLHELIAHAKANPGKLTYAISGIGVTMHLAMEHLASMSGIKWLPVPHKTTGDMLNAVGGGHIDILSSAVSWTPLVETGKLKALAILGSTRMKRMPNVPTAKELGYDVMASSSYGIAGPRGMDPKVVKILHDAFRGALDDPEFVKVMDRLDQVTSYLGTEDYTRWAREQYAVEKVVVEKLGLKQ